MNDAEIFLIIDTCNCNMPCEMRFFSGEQRQETVMGIGPSSGVKSSPDEGVNVHVPQLGVLIITQSIVSPGVPIFSK